MKLSIQVGAVVWWTLLPAVWACRCMQTTVDSTLASEGSTAFRGTILRQLKLNNTDTQTNSFIFQLGRVFKGCDIAAPDRIIITTGSNSAMCGLTLIPGTNYLLTSKGMSQPIDDEIRNHLGKKGAGITRMFWISTCDFTQEWKAVTETDRATLRNHKNRCDLKCELGMDCPDKNYYCDAGKCVAYNAPCPKNVPPTQCFADPCSVTTPCEADAQCHANFCGGCNAIFVSPNGTRVCN